MTALGNDPWVVLYVDDEKSNRVVFEKQFGKMFAIRVAESGEQALGILATEPVAVVVTDQRMPGMSGNELLQQVKHRYPRVVRMIVTAYSDLDPILRAVNEGLVARYVVKPWVRSELETILAWGVEAFAIGREQSEVQLRLLQSERLITLGSITSAVLHDMGNVANHMMANAERLRQHALLSTALDRLARSEGIEESVRKGLQDLAEELPGIAQDLCDGAAMLDGLSKAKSRLLGARAEPSTPANPADAARYAIGIFRTVAAHAELVNEVPESLPRVRLGWTELLQVLINLLSNALQASPPKPARGGRIVVQAAEEADRVRFLVCDEGRGMTAQELARAGTLFWSTRPEGTGLGLAQCKRIVEGAGGKLAIDSKPGAGTSVTFTVPRA